MMAPAVSPQGDLMKPALADAAADHQEVDAMANPLHCDQLVLARKGPQIHPSVRFGASLSLLQRQPDVGVGIIARFLWVQWRLLPIGQGTCVSVHAKPGRADGNQPAPAAWESHDRPFDQDKAGRTHAPAASACDRCCPRLMAGEWPGIEIAAQLAPDTRRDRQLERSEAEQVSRGSALEGCSRPPLRRGLRTTVDHMHAHHPPHAFQVVESREASTDVVYDEGPRSLSTACRRE
jgi:hypothetical protein